MVRRFFFARYRPALVGQLRSAADWRERIEALATFAEPPELEAIVCHGPTGFPIGAICLSGIDRSNGRAELSAGFQRGRGTRAVWEAIHFALHYSFDTLELRKLVLYTLADNAPARTVLDRAGAHPEGVFRAELVRPDGGYADLCRYALFRDSDWPRLHADLQRVAPLATSS